MRVVPAGVLKNKEPGISAGLKSFPCVQLV
jgi:hypothetical protein